MTIPLTPEALAEIRARHAASTQEKWRFEPSWNNAGIPLADFFVPGHNGGATVEMMLEDAEFIVKAHNEDVPALLAEVTRVQAENERLESERARWHRLAQELLTELNTVYERIDSCLPEGPTWGNILARVSAAGAEIKRLHAELARYTAHRETGFQGRGE